jgi:hypothetical protein
MTKKLSVRPRWVEALYEFLADRSGEAPFRQVAEHAAGFVPPGPAWREGTAKRQTDARYRRSGADLAELENLQVVRTGAKRIVLKSIYYERKAGRLVKFDRDGRPWLRATGG